MVPVPEGRSKADAYRSHSEELRVIASCLRDSKTRSTLISVADDFHQMANAEEAIAKSKSLLGRPRESL